MSHGPTPQDAPFSQTQGMSGINLAAKKPAFSPLQARQLAYSGGGRIPARSFAMTQATSPMMSGAPSSSGGDQMSAILKMIQNAQ